MVASNPVELGPVKVTLWFVALLMALSGLITLVGYMTRLALDHQAVKADVLGRAARHGILIGGLLVVWLGLSSLRTLDLKDIVLLTAVAVTLNFYFAFKKR